MFIDIHTHNDSKIKGVTSILNISPEDTAPEHTFFSKSIHPWHIDKESIEKQFIWLQEDVQNPLYLAIGECGLDKKSKTDFELQQKVFEKQLIIADRLSKPVIIHCVGAFQELIALKKKLQIEIPLIIHGFSKGLQLAKDLIRHGFFLAFGTKIIRSENLQHVLSNVSKDFLLLETDHHPLITIQEVYDHVSKLIGEDVNVQIIQNFNRIFNQNLPDHCTALI